jgi:hypothetical protein
MLNEIECKLIYHYDQFILYLFGKRNGNDPEQRIYNKLLQLEGEELENWVNEKLKKYIIGKSSNKDFEDFEGVCKITILISWYTLSTNWLERDKKTNKLVWLSNIYYKSGILLEKELDEINSKLNEIIPITCENNWITDLFQKYLEFYIMNMNANELKEYIIQMIETNGLR